MLEKILKLGRKIIPKPVFRFFQPAYHFCLAVLANIFYRFPGKKIKTIGITGTNGKTTVANMVVTILEEAGFKVGLSSTTNLQVGKKKWANLIDQTMAGRSQSIRLIRQMVAAKCDWAVLEVPSHAISLFRVWGVPFDIAALTNITPEHLDYHKTFQNYVATKRRLFEICARSKPKKNTPKAIILNQDDPTFGNFSKIAPQITLSYGIKKKAQVRARGISLGDNGSKFELITPQDKTDISLKLLGEFNIYNALTATAIALSIGLPIKAIKKGLEKFKGTSGRLQRIETDKGFSVIIDYAHTPDALENLYKTLRPLFSRQLISVFGATGDRDKSKRPVMGEVAARLTDLVIVTDEEPGNEDPIKIIAEIVPGVLQGGKIEKDNFWQINDRKKAIEFALKKAQAGDCVMITGIGHQKFRNIKGVQTPWDEEEIIRDFLGKI